MAKRKAMKQRSIGQGAVSERKAEAIFRVLAEACNREPMFLARSADVARWVNEAGLGFRVSPASVSQAISWLQSRDYIDAGKRGLRVYVFVRIPRWVGDKKVTSADYKDGERIWGHPFKWWDISSLYRRHVLHIFDGLHDVKIPKQLGSDAAPFFRVVDKTQADICKKHNVHQGQYSSEGLDILNTWHMARQYRNGSRVITYEIVRFKHDDVVGFTYEPKIRRDNLFPAPGYLGKPLGLPVVPRVKTSLTVEDPEFPAEIGKGVPLSRPDDITVKNFKHIDMRPTRPVETIAVRQDAQTPITVTMVNESEKDTSRAFTGRPVHLSLLEQDIQDHGLRAAMMIYEIKRAMDQCPETPDGTGGVWVRGPGMFPGDFGGFFGVNPQEIMNAMTGLVTAGRLEYFTGKDGTFYRIKSRDD